MASPNESNRCRIDNSHKQAFFNAWVQYNVKLKTAGRDYQEKDELWLNKAARKKGFDNKNTL